ncbi:hypothetical protein O3P69_010375 [Scylla paramamosain]|uniref:EF-hand domain-containing protein n=1 Tax=Scylla paramamosain TaxID=85552 RepID=A0AAW0TSZ3_SCYPA
MSDAPLFVALTLSITPHTASPPPHLITTHRHTLDPPPVHLQSTFSPSIPTSRRGSPSVPHKSDSGESKEHGTGFVSHCRLLLYLSLTPPRSYSTPTPFPSLPCLSLLLPASPCHSPASITPFLPDPASPMPPATPPDSHRCECPEGVVQEDAFKEIYAKFFPHGNSSLYAHHVFKAFDLNSNGQISFRDLLVSLSQLLRGTAYDKLKFAFKLYDVNGDGCITKAELTDIVSSVHELMGRNSHNRHEADDGLEEVTRAGVEDKQTREHVERLFKKLDLNGDGVVTIDEFIQSCMQVSGAGRKEPPEVVLLQRHLTLTANVNTDGDYW